MQNIKAGDVFAQNPAKKTLKMSSIIFLISVIILLIIQSDANPIKWIATFASMLSGGMVVLALNEALNILVFKNYKLEEMSIKEAIGQKAYYDDAIVRICDMHKNKTKKVICAIHKDVIIAAFPKEGK